MAKKLIIFIGIIFFLGGMLCGCCIDDDGRNCINVYNTKPYVFDNVIIDTKVDYVYDRHEKFTVDENTIGVTIFFVNENEDEWKVKE